MSAQAKRMSQQLGLKYSLDLDRTNALSHDLIKIMVLIKTSYFPFKLVDYS